VDTTQLGDNVLVTPDRSFLFYADEGGGSFCPTGGARAEGSIWVYDIRGAKETAPELIGWSVAGTGPVTGRQLDEASAGTQVVGCTPHVMDMNPDGRSFTIGWYGAGLRVFSFASMYNPDGTPKTSAKGLYWGQYGSGEGLKEIGYMVPDGASTWAAKQYDRVPGYIFANDKVLGFYVTKITS
jgi:hypothetical protein